LVRIFYLIFFLEILKYTFSLSPLLDIKLIIGYISWVKFYKGEMMTYNKPTQFEPKVRIMYTLTGYKKPAQLWLGTEWTYQQGLNMYITPLNRKWNNDLNRWEVPNAIFEELKNGIWVKIPKPPIEFINGYTEAFERQYKK